MSSSSSLKELYSEEKRLKTFQDKGWPLAYLQPEELAKCGFFYMGDDDRVQCPFCGIVIFNWQSGDEPIFEHKIHSGKCPFINGREVGNIFMDTDPRELYNLAQNEDVCGFEHLQTEEKEPIVETSEEPVDLPGISFKPPESIDFITYDSRLATFKEWPASNVMTPEKLAESGFFYKGPVIDYLGRQYMDFVTCFHCNIALCQWNPEDDPWQEHAKFNPDCFYLHLVAFQETLLAALEPETAPETLLETPPSPEPSTSPERPSETSTQISPETSIESSSEKSSETSIETSTTEKSIETPIEKSLEKSLETTLEKSSNTTIESSEKSSEKSTEKSHEYSTEPSIEKSKEKSTEYSPENSTESSIQKSKDKSAETSIEKSPQTLPETSTVSSPPSSQSKSFIPYTWLPKPKSEDLCCKVCLDFQVGATFYPCMHASCSLCASSLSICPICRTSIERVIKLDTELTKTKISFYI